MIIKKSDKILILIINKPKKIDFNFRKIRRKKKKERKKLLKMGCACSKKNSETSILELDNFEPVNGILVVDKSDSKEFLSNIFIKQTTPQDDIKRSYMWCIANIEDYIAVTLQDNGWFLGSSCISMNLLMQKETFYYLYKPNKNYILSSKDYINKNRNNDNKIKYSLCIK